MLKYPKVKNMMGGMPRTPGMPGVAKPMAPMQGAANVMKGPSMSPSRGSAPFGISAPKAAPMTLPSPQTTVNQATPIELGDPQRLGKIATLLRMGRR